MARLQSGRKELKKRWSGEICGFRQFSRGLFSPCHSRRYEKLDFVARATPNHPPKRVPLISPSFGEMWVGCMRRREPRSESPKMPFPTARWISRNRIKTEGGSAELCARRCRYEGHGFQPCHMTLLN